MGKQDVITKTIEKDNLLFKLYCVLDANEVEQVYAFDMRVNHPMTPDSLVDAADILLKMKDVIKER